MFRLCAPISIVVIVCVLLANFGYSQRGADVTASNKASAADAPSFQTDVKPVLKQFCVRCHGPKIQEGRVRLDILNPDMVGGPDAEHWQHALNMVNLGDMPPVMRYRNNIVVDQVAAKELGKHTRYRSLMLSVDGGVGYQSRVSTLSFNDAGKPIPAEHRHREILFRQHWKHFVRNFCIEPAVRNYARPAHTIFPAPT